MAEQRIVYIRPADEQQVYSIAEGNNNTVTIHKTNVKDYWKGLDPIVISRKDWNLYVGAALLIGFDAVKHYHRAYTNQLQWRWKKAPLSAFFAPRHAGKSNLQQMLNQHVFNDDHADALGYALNQKQLIQTKSNP